MTNKILGMCVFVSQISAYFLIMWFLIQVHSKETSVNAIKSEMAAKRTNFTKCEYIGTAVFHRDNKYLGYGRIIMSNSQMDYVVLDIHRYGASATMMELDISLFTENKEQEKKYVETFIGRYSKNLVTDWCSVDINNLNNYQICYKMSSHRGYAPICEPDLLFDTFNSGEYMMFFTGVLVSFMMICFSPVVCAKFF